MTNTACCQLCLLAACLQILPCLDLNPLQPQAATDPVTPQQLLTPEQHIQMLHTAAATWQQYVRQRVWELLQQQRGQQDDQLPHDAAAEQQLHLASAAGAWLGVDPTQQQQQQQRSAINVSTGPCMLSKASTRRLPQLTWGHFLLMLMLPLMLLQQLMLAVQTDSRGWHTG